MQAIDNLAVQIRSYCQSNANPAQAARYARYFTEGYDAWGIDGKHPMWTESIEQWSKQCRPLGVQGVLSLGETLFRGGKYEEGGAAIHLLSRCNDEFDKDTLAGVAKWFAAGIANWGHTDVLCTLVLSPVLAAGRVSIEDFGAWRDSPFKYQRRAVPVSMLGLLKTKAKTGPLLRFVEPLMRDGEKVVQQGVGWFLRESWKRDAAPVEKLLYAHREEAPRVIIQYATEKMTAAERERYRRTKKPSGRAVG